MYFVYMLRCQDNSLYTGITTNVDRRMKEHFSQGKLGAKYTKRHKPKQLECVLKCKNRSEASQLEYHIKQLTKANKEEFIYNSDNDFLKNLEIEYTREK